MLGLPKQVDDPTRLNRWTPELEAQLLALVAIHPEDGPIADAMGISFEAVRHRRIKLGIMRRRPINVGQWTPERVTMLATMRDGGHSADQIAKALGEGFTRKAVLGKAFRLKLPRLTARVTPEKAKRERKPREARPPRQRPLLRLVIDNTPDIDTPIEQRCSLMDLNKDTCRWPVGDVGAVGFFFCGAPSAGFTYCPKHHVRAYKERTA